MNLTTWSLRTQLPDNTEVEFRLSTPADFPNILAYQATLSDQTIYSRFFNLRRPTPEELQRLTHGATPEGTVFLGLRADRVIALARYVNIHPQKADVAFTVSDAYQGQQIGALLLQLLAAHAYSVGITQFSADILGQNHRMRSVFKSSNLQAKFEPIQSGSASLQLDLTHLEPLLVFLQTDSRPPKPIGELLSQLSHLRR